MFRHNSEALDYIYNLLDTNKVALGLAQVWYSDDEWSAPYPSAVLSAGGLSREPHATQTFRVVLQVSIYIMHANMSVDHKTRTREDLLFAEGVSDFLHTDKKLGGNVINGMVTSENPGVVNRPKGAAVVSTSLSWVAESRQAF